MVQKAVGLRVLGGGSSFPGAPYFRFKAHPGKAWNTGVARGLEAVERTLQRLSLILRPALVEEQENQEGCLSANGTC